METMGWGTRVTQLVKHPTLDFSPGPDLTVGETEPCADSPGPAWDSLSPSLSAPAPTRFEIKAPYGKLNAKHMLPYGI